MEAERKLGKAAVKRVADLNMAAAAGPSTAGPVPSTTDPAAAAAAAAASSSSSSYVPIPRPTAGTSRRVPDVSIRTRAPCAHEPNRQAWAPPGVLLWREIACVRGASMAMMQNVRLRPIRLYHPAVFNTSYQRYLRVMHHPVHLEGTLPGGGVELATCEGGWRRAGFACGPALHVEWQTATQDCGSLDPGRRPTGQ